MNVKSIKIESQFINYDLSGELKDNKIIIHHFSKKLGKRPWNASKNIHNTYEFPIDSCYFSRFDDGRNAGKAAAGAIVGGMIFGSAGALLGGAGGGKKIHSLLVKNHGAVIVIEISTAELQNLVGRGVELDKDAKSNEKFIIKTKEKSNNVRPLLAFCFILFVFWVFVLEGHFWFAITCVLLCFCFKFVNKVIQKRNPKTAQVN